MKTINETFDDKDYETLIRIKGDLTWKKFIIQSAGFFDNAKTEIKDTLEKVSK